MNIPGTTCHQTTIHPMFVFACEDHNQRTITFLSTTKGDIARITLTACQCAAE